RGRLGKGAANARSSARAGARATGPRPALPRPGDAMIRGLEEEALAGTKPPDAGALGDGWTSLVDPALAGTKPPDAGALGDGRTSLLGPSPREREVARRRRARRRTDLAPGTQPSRARGHPTPAHSATDGPRSWDPSPRER